MSIEILIALYLFIGYCLAHASDYRNVTQSLGYPRVPMFICILLLWIIPTSVFYISESLKAVAGWFK